MGPYFIVALSVLKVKFCLVPVHYATMPKPETVSRLCTKCHSKTVHEVREKTVAGIKLICTDCGHTLVVTNM
jgi:predicted SprT family Zn-dependent metalloprotease